MKTIATLLMLVPGIAAAQGVPTWTLAPAGQVGQADGPSALTRISFILSVQGDPSLAWVAQPSEQHVKLVHAAKGAVLSVSGRPGEGPGELRSVSRLSWHFDTLVVADRNQQHLVLFTTDGEHIRTERIVSEVVSEARRPAQGVALMPSGGVWGEPPVDMLMVANAVVSRVPIVSMQRDGSIVRHVAELKVGGAMSAADYGTGVSVFVQPLMGRLLHSYSPDGSFVAVVDVNTAESQFSITRVDETGDTAFVRRFRYSPRPVTAGQRDSLYEVYATNFSRGNSHAAAIDLAREHVRVPSTHPPISAVLISSNGEIWLRREEIERGNEWVVLDPNGQILAYVTAPADTQLLGIADEYAWGMRTGQFDIPYVVRLRINRQP